MLNIEETDYFGLYYQDISNNKYWLEPNKSIKKQIKSKLILIDIAVFLKH